MSAVTLCAATLPAEEGAPGFGMTAKLRLQRGDRWDDVARRLAAALAADPASLLYLDARGRPVAAADDAALGILLDDAERLFEWLRPRGMDELVCVLGGPRTDAARAVEALKWERALWGAPPSVAEGASAAAAALATGTDADQEPSISVTPAEPASAAPASAPAPSGEPALPSPSALFSDHPHHSFRRPPGALGPLPLPAVPMHMIPTPGGTYPAPSPGYSPALSPFDRPGTAGSGQGGYFPHPGYFGAYNPAWSGPGHGYRPPQGDPAGYYAAAPGYGYPPPGYPGPAQMHQPRPPQQAKDAATGLLVPGGDVGADGSGMLDAKAARSPSELAASALFEAAQPRWPSGEHTAVDAGTAASGGYAPDYYDPAQQGYPGGAEEAWANYHAAAAAAAAAYGHAPAPVQAGGEAKRARAPARRSATPDGSASPTGAGTGGGGGGNAGGSGPFACPMCGKRFTRRFNLHSHQLSHNGLRPYSCTHPGCDKSFARKHDLKRHAKLHGEKEFACPRCGGRFARGDAMERHKRSSCRGPGGAPRGAGGRKKREASEEEDGEGEVEVDEGAWQ